MTMGWTFSHLWEFDIDGRCYGDPSFREFDDEPPICKAKGLRLGVVISRGRGSVRLHLRLRRQLAPRRDRRGGSRRRPGQGISGLRGRGQALSAGGRRRPGGFMGFLEAVLDLAHEQYREHGSLVRRAVRPDRLRRGAGPFLHGEHGAPTAWPAGQSQERIAASETMTVAPGMAGRIDAASSAEKRQAAPKTLRNGPEFEKICIWFDDGF